MVVAAVWSGAEGCAAGMFFGDAAPNRKVTLRGSSKQQDRQSILDRAAREREARQMQRVRHRSATLLQSASRRRAALSKLCARERAGWEALVQRAREVESTPDAVPALGALIRAALVLDGSLPADPGDAARRSDACALVLRNASAADARVNRCAAMCSIEVSSAGVGGVSPAAAWRVQARGLVAMCVRAVAQARGAGARGAGTSAAGAAVERTSALSVSSELALLAYLTDSSAWAWLSLLPVEVDATRVARAARELALWAGEHGAHEIAWGGVHTVGTQALRLVDDDLALCALSLRALRAPFDLGLAPASRAAGAQAVRFGRAALTIPGVAFRLPAPLGVELRADRALLAHVLQAICAERDALVASMGPSPEPLPAALCAPRDWPAAPAGARSSAGATRGGAAYAIGPAHAASALAPMAFLGNAISLAHVLVLPALADAPAANASVPRSGARLEPGTRSAALSAYVSVLHALLGGWTDAHMAQIERRALPGGAGSESDDGGDGVGARPLGAGGDGGVVGGGTAGGTGASAMDVERAPASASAEHGRIVDMQLRVLVEGTHAGPLFSALLPVLGADGAPGASALHTAPALDSTPLAQLCSLYCMVLAHGAPLTAHASASSGAHSAAPLLSTLVFSTALAPRLWACVSVIARRLGGTPTAWASAEVEGPLCLFCQLANHALVVLSDAELLGPAPTDGPALGSSAGASAAAAGAVAASSEPGLRPGGPILLPREQLRPMCLALKELAVHLLWASPPASPRTHLAASTGGGAGSAACGELHALRRTQVTKLLVAMHQRDARRPFIGDRLAWLAGGSPSGMAATIMAVVQNARAPTADVGASAVAVASSAGGGAAETERAMALLRSVPFTLPFEGRLGALRAWISADRQAHGVFDLHHMWPQPIRVRRASMLADSFAALRGAGSGLKMPLRVQFFNEQARAAQTRRAAHLPSARPPRSARRSSHGCAVARGPSLPLIAPPRTRAQGLEEAGIGEGVMKEYLVELIRAACAPSARLFAATSDGELYPSPAARHAVVDSAALFEFAGAMFAKALYEGILLDVPLAPFFLAIVLGTTNTVNDLPALDPELHRNLLFLKGYTGALEDLALCFAVRVPALARARARRRAGAARCTRVGSPATPCATPVHVPGH